MIALAACTPGKPLHGVHEDFAGGNLKQMGLLTPRFGYALTDGRFVSTEDAGATWHDLTPVDAPAATLRAGYFFDQARAWTASWDDATGKLVVYRSASGGASWRSTTLATDYRDGVGNVTFDFVSPTHGWLDVERVHSSAFDTADLYATADGGETWTKLALPEGQGSEINLATDTIGFVVAGPRHDRLLRTDDGGATWQDRGPAKTYVHSCPPSTPSPAAQTCGVSSEPTMTPPGWSQIGPITVVTYLEGSTAFTISWSEAQQAVGTSPGGHRPDVAVPWVNLPDGEVIAYADGSFRREGAQARGLPEVRQAVTPTGLPDAVLALSFPDEQHGWATASRSSCPKGKSACVSSISLYFTADGGRTWTELQP